MQYDIYYLDNLKMCLAIRLRRQARKAALEDADALTNAELQDRIDRFEEESEKHLACESNLLMPTHLYDSQTPTLSEEHANYKGEKSGIHREYSELIAMSLYEMLRGMGTTTENQGEFMEKYEERRDSPGSW